MSANKDIKVVEQAIMGMTSQEFKGQNQLQLNNN